jgi:uncharacterized protein YndB with AHSA1/START domain
MTQASLDTNGTRPVIRFERILPHPPEVVWRSLTDRDELNGWFPTDIIAGRVEGRRPPHLRLP